ncbi:hypothetical protein B0T10DRAFT_569050 [Thelonectria olida]|uniref:Uncharacterized protein n=1 Tax=Thelonectria olida TaxID=1576542 RepID=A0A9P8VPX8_9HYPO|nr:hypothetical protein B0T10DRAFT_569050 [Thelonectria olida]
MKLNIFLTAAMVIAPAIAASTTTTTTETAKSTAKATSKTSKGAAPTMHADVLGAAGLVGAAALWAM